MAGASARLLGGTARLALFEAKPGTYVLTDHLAASFHRFVVVELGLDRYPELRDDYFGRYRRVVWLPRHPTARRAPSAADLGGASGAPTTRSTDCSPLGAAAHDETPRLNSSSKA